MLKIKDNVDLKELEKYGFKRVRKNTTNFTCDVLYWYTLNNSEYDCITIFRNREIYFGMDCYGKTYDVIYDLIKDGLVEKVDI